MAGHPSFLSKFSLLIGSLTVSYVPGLAFSRCLPLLTCTRWYSIRGSCFTMGHGPRTHPNIVLWCRPRHPRHEPTCRAPPQPNANVCIALNVLAASPAQRDAGWGVQRVEVSGSRPSDAATFRQKRQRQRENRAGWGAVYLRRAGTVTTAGGWLRWEERRHPARVVWQCQPPFGRGHVRARFGLPFHSTDDGSLLLATEPCHPVYGRRAL